MTLGDLTQATGQYLRSGGGSIDPFALIAGNLIDQTFDGLHSIGYYLAGQYKDSHYDGRGFENYDDRVGAGINGLLLASGPLLKGMPALNYADDAEILIKNAVGAAAKGFSKSAAKTSRGLWALTKEGTSVIKNHKTFGTIYKSSSDGLWWAVDKAGHGGSKFKVFKETNKGLEWFKDADEFGDFIINKHKGSTGTFIPWGQLGTVK